MLFDPTEHPHRRYNPLTSEWVTVSPHRAKRPWQGKIENPPPEDLPSHDPDCYLCPGNIRTSGIQNPVYQHTFVFTNDFSAILPDTPEKKDRSGMLQLENLRGTCRVICFSPYHNLSLPEMDQEEVRLVIDVWAGQTAELGLTYPWVQVFENKGQIMGSSMPHPHGQIWALDVLPNEPFKENLNQLRYYKEHGKTLLLSYGEVESQAAVRTVLENEDWLVMVPYWAIWPFETLLLPKRHIPRLPDLNDAERNSLAHILKGLLTKYDNLFKTSFPYSMGWHGAPYLENDPPVEGYWQLHAHFYPPLLRSATIKKFMVGYEMLAEAQRDLTAEQAAEHLKILSDLHYKQADR
jgi:UDPglucose--hexose-1-phosphate uridylyltransferase